MIFQLSESAFSRLTIAITILKLVYVQTVGNGRVPPYMFPGDFTLCKILRLRRRIVNKSATSTITHSSFTSATRALGTCLLRTHVSLAWSLNITQAAIIILSDTLTWTFARKQKSLSPLEMTLPECFTERIGDQIFPALISPPQASRHFRRILSLTSCASAWFSSISACTT